MKDHSHEDFVKKVMQKETSLGRRMKYVVTSLLGMGSAGTAATLLATEAELPFRTQLAFALIVGVGLAWSVFATWRLSRKAPLFARDKVIAGWLSVGATTLFASLAMIVAASRSVTASLAVAGFALMILILAVSILRNAIIERDALLDRLSKLQGTA